MKQLLTSLLVAAATVPALAWNVTTDPEPRSSVVEEFTGIHCGNCPSAHRRAARLHQSHHGDFFTVAIHAGSFATPGQGQPDYTTEDGNKIHDHFMAYQYPIGVVSRHPSSGQYLVGHDQWGPITRTLVAQTSPVNLWSASSFDSATRTLTVNVEGYFTSTMKQPKLTVMLLQNNVLGPQQSGAAGDQYPHRHMLRKVLTDTWGDAISEKNSGEYFSREVKYVLPADINGIPLIPSDIEVLSFVAEGDLEIMKASSSFPSVTDDPDARYIVALADPLIGIENSYSLDFLEACIDNYTGEAITKLTFKATLSDHQTEQDAQTIDIDVNIPAHEPATVQIPLNGKWKPFLGKNGVNRYSLELLKANDKDINFNNGAISGSFQRLPKYPTKINATFMSDGTSGDNRYLLLDEGGNIVREFGPYTKAGEHQETLELLNGQNYTIEVSDIWGDGISAQGSTVKLTKPIDGSLCGQISRVNGYGARMSFTADETVGIENIAGEAGAELVSEKYYDITGRRVSAPESGAYIVTRTYSDGTTRTEKAIR